ncbi:MAG TPA: hypothetical protein DCQ51_20565 [Planktothrix sp. UBA8407]|nr:hypothetical protein [Planktothrix sp. UBA8407]HBK23371.1 hypothetical protein [Planktothrix sp. UBA10369]
MLIYLKKCTHCNSLICTGSRTRGRGVGEAGGAGQGVFKVGGKKENKSDLFLLKLKKDHFYLILKNYVKQYN